MIKGGALLLSVVISLVLGILTFMLILFGFYNNLEIKYLHEKNRLIRNVTSGMNLFLGECNYIKINEEKTFDLYDSGLDSVRLTRKRWGIYEIGIVKAFQNTNSIQKSFILGCKSAETFALYLSDFEQPLFVSGKTKISGLCFLPKSGVKTEYIQDQSFEGRKAIEGTIKPSNKTLPILNKEAFHSILQVLNRNHKRQPSTLTPISDLKDSIYNSFTEQTIMFGSDQQFVLENKVIEGNVVIISSQKIKIKKNNVFTDILIMAPKIEVETGFEGTVQFFANDSLIVGENVKLRYPSTLGIIGTTNYSTSYPRIIIGQGSKVDGTLVSWFPNEYGRGNSLICISPLVQIRGEVITTGYLDLRGKVEGRVICPKFLLNTTSSKYENRLFNAVIDCNILPKNYLFSTLCSESPGRGILKQIN